VAATTKGQIEIEIVARGSSNQKKDARFRFPSNVLAPADHRLNLTDNNLVSLTYTVGVNSTTCTFDGAGPQRFQVWPK
jgi:hypothetical protein